MRLGSRRRGHFWGVVCPKKRVVSFVLASPVLGLPARKDIDFLSCQKNVAVFAASADDAASLRHNHNGAWCVSSFARVMIIGKLFVTVGRARRR
jgi:hypothetical protein